MKSLYIDTNLASFGEKGDDKPNSPEAKVIKQVPIQKRLSFLKLAT